MNQNDRKVKKGKSIYKKVERKNRILKVNVFNFMFNVLFILTKKISPRNVELLPWYS